MIEPSVGGGIPFTRPQPRWTGRNARRETRPDAQLAPMLRSVDAGSLPPLAGRIGPSAEGSIGAALAGRLRRCRRSSLPRSKEILMLAHPLLRQRGVVALDGMAKEFSEFESRAEAPTPITPNGSVRFADASAAAAAETVRDPRQGRSPASSRERRGRQTSKRSRARLRPNRLHLLSI
jgi:hypothetical protein